jgi:hypothetical protein
MLRTSTSKSEEGAPSNTDSEITTQPKNKFTTSTNRSEEVQILTILSKRQRKKNKKGYSIKLHD